MLPAILRSSMNRFPLGEKPLPRPLPLKQLIGPSIILLGLGLGSGEVILWPYLVSNYGLGVVWGMVVGITIQFFLNMEIERYALARGESIFVGFARLYHGLPIWFAISTFIGFGWPGIGQAGSSLFSAAFGNTFPPTLISIGLFIAVGIALSLGRVVYSTVETILKWIIGVGVPFLVILSFFFIKPVDFITLGQGFIGIGDGYIGLPTGIAIGVFLGALAYSGAGGNLNLSQSFYVRDKGYGMGIHMDRIKSLITGGGSTQTIRLTGHRFPLTKPQLARFQEWWRLVNLEHFLVFWCLGLFSMITLAMLAYTTSYGLEGNAEGITFVLNQAATIASQTFPLLGSAFLVVTGTMLFGTQMTILDSTSRIIAENILLLQKNMSNNGSRAYYAVLWTQILFGLTVLIIGFDQPKQLITLGALINAFAMFIFAGLLLLVNNGLLEKPLRPSWFRNLAVSIGFVVLGGFSFYNMFLNLR